MCACVRVLVRVSNSYSVCTGTSTRSIGFKLTCVMLALQGEPDAMPKGTHDIYDDDWLWQRGHVGSNNTDLRFSEVLCVPRVIKNQACRYSDDDAGIDCTADLAWAYDAVRVTEKADWLDFSTPTYIECVVESLGTPLSRYGVVASVNVTVANSSTLVDYAGLAANLDEARANFNCLDLAHCMRKDASSGLDLDWFGSGTEYDGATQEAPSAFHFTADYTPVVEHINPTRAMPGSLIDIHGTNFVSTIPFTDTNWYMSELGYYEQPSAVSVTVGSYPCQIFSLNDTLVQCYAIFGSMLEPMDVKVAIHGLGNAECDAVFTFAIDVYTVTPSFGSLAGGTTVTIGTSNIGDPAAGFEASIKSFDVWLVPEGSQVSSEAEARADADSVVTDPVAAAQTETSVTFVSPTLNEAVGRLPSLENERALATWLLTTWDGNEIYSECSSKGNCSFAYSASATPVLALNKSESHFLSHQPDYNKLSDSSVTSLVAGDIMALEFDTSVQANGTAFNWTAVDPSTVSVTLNNASLVFELSVAKHASAVAGATPTHTVRLLATVGDHVPPCAPCDVQVQVEPWGRAVVFNRTVEVLPVVAGLSHTAGSSEGGLSVTVSGRGLDVAGSPDAPVVTIGDGASCAVERSNSTSLTCTTSAYSGGKDAAAFNVSVAVAGAASACVRAGGRTFAFSNNTAHTPKFGAVEPSTGHWPTR